MALNVATEAALAGAYPAVHLGKREQKIVKILKTYIDEAAGQSLAEGKIWIGNGDDEAAAVTPTGDVTISSAGVTAIAAGAIVNADVNAAAAIAYSKLALTNSLVAGDLTSGAVTLAKLAAGVSPSHIVKFAGTFTTVGGDASESITVAGALATDTCVVTVKTAGGTPRSIVAAAAGTDAIAVTMSGDPSTDHVLQYQIFRATA